MQKAQNISRASSKTKIDKLCPKQHQGVLGMINPIRFHDPQDLVSTIFEQGKSPCLLFLDGISDVRNFGAIARSAEVFGIDGIILTRKILQLSMKKQ